MMRRIITVGLGVLTGWSVRAVAFHIGLETQAATGLMVLILLHLFLSANQHARELEMVGDDCYADGYEQRVLDERAGIQRLPTHRP
jgi:hypothetical protein